MVVRQSALKSYTKRKPRRRANLANRAKSQRPTAQNQKRQIVSLARRVSLNTRAIRSQRVYTDYQFGDCLADTTGIVTELEGGIWQGFALTDFSKWRPVLRQDINVQSSSKTFCLRSQLNCRVDIGDVLQIAYINLFLVSLRRDATDVVVLTPPPVGSMSQLDLNQDYIEGSLNQGVNIRLNPARYKVHASKYITLLPNMPTVPLPVGSVVGNPYSTWRKWQWDLPLKFSVRTSATTRPWLDLRFDDMAHYQKYYLLAYSTNLGGSNGPSFTCDILSTCVNTS